MATLTLRPTDCLAGGGGYGAACRGRVLAPEFRRQKQEQEEGQAAVSAGTAPPHGSKQARPPGSGGRANGRQRGRGSHRAGAPRQPQMRAMENVVILKRGEHIAQEIRAALTVLAPDLCGAAVEEKDGPVPAEDRCCAPAENAEPLAAARRCDAPEKMGEPVAEAVQCVAPAKRAEAVAEAVQCAAPPKMAEPVVEAVQCVAPAKRAKAAAEAGQCVTPAKMDEPVVSAEQIISPAANAEPVVAAEQCIATAKNAELAAAADQRGSSSTKAKTAAPVLYSGPSFVISPDPSDLPIPGFLLKPRGVRSAACG